MDIDWLQTIEDIFGDEITCPRCGLSASRLLAGYSYELWAAHVAPRCKDHTDKDTCESRKLVFLCDNCAKELRLRAKPVDRTGMMTLLVEDCRKDLEDCLDYLLEGWQDDLDIDPQEMVLRLEDFAPRVFEEENVERANFEEEYLGYHRWFREHKVAVPDAGWRSRYVEEIIGLAYATLLGD